MGALAFKTFLEDDKSVEAWHSPCIAFVPHSGNYGTRQLAGGPGFAQDIAIRLSVVEERA